MSETADRPTDNSAPTCGLLVDGLGTIQKKRRCRRAGPEPRLYRASSLQNGIQCSRVPRRSFCALVVACDSPGVRFSASNVEING